MWSLFDFNLILNWVRASKITGDIDPHTDSTLDPVNNLTNATFKITGTKLYITVVILSTKDDNKLLKHLKSECRRIIKWNKYRSEMSNQPISNKLKHLIDQTFNKVNRFFVFSIETEDDRTYFLALIRMSFVRAVFREEERGESILPPTLIFQKEII